MRPPLEGWSNSAAVIQHTESALLGDLSECIPRLVMTPMARLEQKRINRTLSRIKKLGTIRIRCRRLMDRNSRARGKFRSLTPPNLSWQLLLHPPRPHILNILWMGPDTRDHQAIVYLPSARFKTAMTARREKEWSQSQRSYNRHGVLFPMGNLGPFYYSIMQCFKIVLNRIVKVQPCNYSLEPLLAEGFWLRGVPRAPVEGMSTVTSRWTSRFWKRWEYPPR